MPRSRLFDALLAVLTLLVAMVATERPARAAAIEEVTGFGSNPGDLRMFRYVPTGLPTGRPLVVVMHGCTQDAAGYGSNSGWTRLADAHGFALTLPQQKQANNANSCFNWFETADTARGSGEALSIKQMVDRMRADMGSASTYVTGLSAGGAMTAVMLATYPDVFAGGGIVAGIPYRCATTVSAAFTCMSRGVGMTPAQWGDKVRAAFAHTGPKPKVSIWHGSADTTVKPVNRVELVDQWTNVHGTDQSLDVSDTIGGYPHKVYGSVVESYEITGMNHGHPVDPGTGPTQCGTTAAYVLDVNMCSAYHIARFWGLVGGVVPTSTTTTPPTGVCHTDHNYGHVAAGRAHHAGGYTYANGSNQEMGLYNTFVRHTLKETPPGHFVVADTGCP
ncbi:Poly(3-hydroxyalkanoate) depolymerase [Alloactinosynnema sp. L-07]|uniref:extracellular catalytic domain type 1 short-chain-length polyhydroxyalkanoate depolymerase n=1 Tax=Alloactinosynnema sp. L-07 TaxID=1653480 RepID=UPI00065F019F|nr:PHB depolymerase family esterase [Alloactinosynnema sp. L-07]CRK60020.1 Poly(3-hydroxyalkanoate) depolymerase [Alloactinosynnema sp. L-07]